MLNYSKLARNYYTLEKCGSGAGTHMSHKHTCRQNIHMCNIKINISQNDTKKLSSNLKSRKELAPGLPCDKEQTILSTQRTAALLLWTAVVFSGTPTAATQHCPRSLPKVMLQTAPSATVQGCDLVLVTTGLGVSIHLAL